MSSLQEEKQALREILRVRRAQAARAGKAAAERLAERFLRVIPVPSRATIAGYLPIGDEIDVRPLLRRIADRGCGIALPAVIQPGAPLVFRLWTEGDGLIEGPFRTKQPVTGAVEILPDAVIMPLLAFDRRGFRLGYGGGYYDRTLAAVRRQRKILTVGVGFADQEVPAVPCGRHDQPMDWIVTDREAIEPGRVA